MNPGVELNPNFSGGVDSAPPESFPPPPPPREPATPATFGLLAVCVAVFLLENYWGGSENGLTLFKMGASYGPGLLLREPWRLLSPAFLHIGFLHLLMNGWALYVFGRVLEQWLGSRRFLALYGLSAIGGTLLSVLVHPRTLAAGASTAIWGLMCAFAGIAVNPRGFIRPEAISRLRRAALMPVFVNLAFSLSIPKIDLAGHLGGGLAGFLLGVSGVLTAGLIPGTERRDGSRPGAWFASLGLPAALFMALSLAFALKSGRAWELRAPPALHEIALPDGRLRVRVPAGDAFGTPDADGWRTAGDPNLVLIGVSYKGVPLDPSDRPPDDPTERAAYLNGLRDELANQPPEENVVPLKPPEVDLSRNAIRLFWTVKTDGGAYRVSTACVPDRRGTLHLIRVEIPPDLPASWTGTDLKILDSVRLVE